MRNRRWAWSTQKPGGGGSTRAGGGTIEGQATIWKAVGAIAVLTASAAAAGPATEWVERKAVDDPRGLGGCPVCAAIRRAMISGVAAAVGVGAAGLATGSSVAVAADLAMASGVVGSVSHWGLAESADRGRIDGQLSRAEAATIGGLLAVTQAIVLHVREAPSRVSARVCAYMCVCVCCVCVCVCVRVCVCVCV